MALDRDRIVVTGRVSGVFGVKGWIRIHSYTDPKEAVFDYPDWLIDTGSGWQAIDVAEGRPHGKTLIARFADVEDRDQATAFVGAALGVRRHVLPEISEGRFYWSDLEGLKVEDAKGEDVGIVAYLLETGAHDVLVVRQADGQEVLIPFVFGKTVTRVGLQDGVIGVDWDWN